MVAFYRALGFDVAEHPHVVSVYVGQQMINFHRPETWQREASRCARRRRCRRAAISASCGTPHRKRCRRLDAAGAAIIEGPVAREGGRRAAATSVYVRDPDGNLLEFMIYV